MEPISDPRGLRRAGRPASLAAAVLAAVLLVLLTATGARAATVPGDAWVRAGHLVPGLQAMDVTATPAGGGATVELALGAGYGDVAPYQRLAPGTYTAEVRPAGAARTSAPVLSSTFTADAGKAYTLAGLGSLQAPRLATLQDDLTPPAAGQVRVRVLPAASAAPAVTVTARNGPVIADGAAFGQPTAYASVPAGQWVLETAAAGLPAATATVDLAAGGVYTLVVVDADGALGVRAVTDAAGAAAMPVGGAQTGGGGTAAAAASAPRPDSVPVLTGAAVLLLAAVLVRRRVRGRTA
ncbi:DUF4397 domain-containing protein [Kineococcus rubinsiae]|uniref:DUF4397 domain-containing protein n=1 Tax=Kineococcus rubinsiae TaxID=2609562 RepID=UPI00142FBDCA|nr:DUF4397 domain-containing protein [Kineococcus rubinsiae]NIZ92776.1 DUF4397 domain-containing protein [Kineococcus rubinsiae]